LEGGGEWLGTGRAQVSGGGGEYAQARREELPEQQMS